MEAVDNINNSIIIHTKSETYSRKNTLFENENEWQKTEQVPIPLLSAALLGTSPMLKQETKQKSICGPWI